LAGSLFITLGGGFFAPVFVPANNLFIYFIFFISFGSFNSGFGFFCGEFWLRLKIGDLTIFFS
jgi:hypothetical protein